MEQEYELYHHGILGMKWGIRRFQNKDGTLTAAGKKRYGSTQALEIDKALTDRAKAQRGKQGQKSRKILDRTEDLIGKAIDANHPELYDLAEKYNKARGEFDRYAYKLRRRGALSGDTKYTMLRMATAKAFQDYTNECKKVVDDILGEIGKEKTRELFTDGKATKSDVATSLIRSYHARKLPLS